MESYVEWCIRMANERKVCLACEQEAHFAKATAEELEAAQPCAWPHDGMYCTKVAAA